VSLGLLQLFVTVPTAYDAVRYAGASYLLFLAWQAFRSDSILALPRSHKRPLSALTMFRQGLVTNLFNPKMALFVLMRNVPASSASATWNGVRRACRAACL
jgi:threonine/homoserine/homoserine lactone efflux protein